MKKSCSLCRKVLIYLLLFSLLPIFSVALSAQEYEKDTDYVIDDAELEYLFTADKYLEGHVVQGFAIHNGVVFQFHDGGSCNTYDFNTGEKLGTFHLGSFYSHNHSAQANFGWVYPEGNTKFPALYVSGDLTTKACYVENVTETSAQLIQTIYFDVEPSTYTGGQVILDQARNRIVYMQREKSSIGDFSNTFRMFEFPIPSLDAGKEIHLTPADMLCEPYVLPFYTGTYQGAYIYGNTLLQSHGKSKSANEYGAKVGLLCFDTATHDFTRAINLTALNITVEPQAVFVYEGRLIMNFVNGNFYEIKPKLSVSTDSYDTVCVENEEQLLANLSKMIPAPYTWKDADTESLTWDTSTGGFSVNVTLQTPYNDMQVTLTGTALTHHWSDYCFNEDATCTADGTQTRVCAHDGEGTHIQTVPAPNTALNHSFGEWVVTTPATETAAGESTRTCTRCGETETKPLEKLPAEDEPNPMIPVLICVGTAAAISFSAVGITIAVRKKKRA